MSSSWFAFVLNLHSAKTAIVEASTLYKLGPATAVPLHLTTDHVDKTVEYGRKVYVERDKKVRMVRHIIIRVSDDLKILESEQALQKRIAPKRLSLGKAVERVSDYSYPSERREERDKNKGQKVIGQSASTAVGSSIIQTFKLRAAKIKEATTSSTVNADASAAPTLQSVEDSISDEGDQDVCLTSPASPTSQDSDREKDTCLNPEHIHMHGRLNVALTENEEAQKQLQLVNEMISFFKTTIVTKLKNIEGAIGNLKRSKQDLTVCRPGNSRLESELPRNLFDPDDNEELPPSTFKIGRDRYVTLAELCTVEQCGYFTGRVEQLCDIFCDGASGEYTVDAKKKDLTLISSQDIDILITIMRHMKWDKKVRLTADTVRDRLIRHTSECRRGGKVKPIKRSKDDLAEKKRKKKHRKEESGHHSKDSHSKKRKKRSFSTSSEEESSSSVHTPQKGRKKRKVSTSSSSSN